MDQLTTAQHASLSRWGRLPERMKLLSVGNDPQQARLLSQGLQTDSAVKVQLCEVAGGTAAMAKIREEIYDAVVVMHQPGLFDALDWTEAARTTGCEQPIIVLGTAPNEEMAAFCYEVGADGYCSPQTTTRCLLWMFARAMERNQLIRENSRMQQADRQRLEFEHREADRLLGQQRELVKHLETLSTTPPQTAEHCIEDQSAAQQAWQAQLKFGQQTDKNHGPINTSLPQSLVRRYQDMLRAYVIMGSGNLAEDMATLSEELVAAGITARQTMQLHVQVLEEFVAGLGNRSARHVLNRADLLVLEITVHLAEGYRRQAQDRSGPLAAKGSAA